LELAFTLFFFVQGRVYAFTILANLLLGFPGKAAPTETNTLSRRTTTSRRLTTAGRRTSTNNASGDVFRLEYLESSDDNSSNRVCVLSSRVVSLPAHSPAHRILTQSL
jgi:hypothetical protein